MRRSTKDIGIMKSVALNISSHIMCDTLSSSSSIVSAFGILLRMSLSLMIRHCSSSGIISGCGFEVEAAPPFERLRDMKTIRDRYNMLDMIIRAVIISKLEVT